MGRSHLITGVVTGMAVCAIARQPIEVDALVIGVSAYSALAPDVDHPAAPAARCLGPASWALCWLARTVSWHTTGTTHRGWTHSLAFCAMWGVLLVLGTIWWLPVQAALWTGLAGFVGATTHIGGDLLTLSGCKYVLWPYRAQISVPYMFRFRTGGRAEPRVVFVIAALSVLLIPAVLAG